MLPNHQNPLQKAKQWIYENSIDGGIIHSSSLRMPYPEVTGYFIPSLLKWGEIDLAKSYGDWLISIQTTEGGWQDTSLQTLYTFDTGQILKGMYELISFGQKYEDSFLKGCDWLLTQIDGQGRIHTPTTEHFSGIGSEYIHLYAIEPLKYAGDKYGRQDYLDAVARAVQHYLSQNDLIDFKFLSHFHAYVVEALIDLEQEDRARQALRDLELNYQKSNGSIPAYHNVRWVCLTALFQYALCYYKLGELEKGNKLFDFALSKQNKTGGFYGGSGWFVTYFKNTEISWPVKYFLDALYWRKQLENKQ